jgi:hypothetical protein
LVRSIAIPDKRKVAGTTAEQSAMGSAKTANHHRTILKAQKVAAIWRGLTHRPFSALRTVQSCMKNYQKKKKS